MFFKQFFSYGLHSDLNLYHDKLSSKKKLYKINNRNIFIIIY